jgi:hypothetical protein
LNCNGSKKIWIFSAMWLEVHLAGESSIPWIRTHRIERRFHQQIQNDHRITVIYLLFGPIQHFWPRKKKDKLLFCFRK